ncbi:MAG: class I SAM-dependent methyltransferase [Myxococcota bacterium]|nr:class I SAM-dependent methyltransferase [Myxococcota bacterium]
MSHDEHSGHSGHQEHRFEDPESYAERWNAPERDAWQQPQAIIDAMELEGAMKVADLGAGTGYFLPFLSAAVGPEGEVFAIDTESSMLSYIDKQMQAAGLSNVTTVQADASSSGLQEQSVDRILSVNVWHHIPNRGSYSQHLFERLRPGGSVWIVDFLEDSPMGPPLEHRLPPEVVLEELRAGGFDASIHPLALERQYLIVGKR